MPDITINSHRLGLMPPGPFCKLCAPTVVVNFGEGNMHLAIAGPMAKEQHEMIVFKRTYGKLLRHKCFSVQIHSQTFEVIILVPNFPFGLVLTPPT